MNEARVDSRVRQVSKVQRKQQEMAALWAAVREHAPDAYSGAKNLSEVRQCVARRVWADADKADMSPQEVVMWRKRLHLLQALCAATGRRVPLAVRD